MSDGEIATGAGGAPDGDRFYKELLDNLYDGVYFVDLQRRVTYWNRGAERLTGYGSQEVLGRSCADDILVHHDTEGGPLCRDGCPVAETLLDGQIREKELFLLHKKGHRVPVTVRVAPMRGGDGAVTGVIQVFSDSSSQTATLSRLAELEAIAFLDPLTEVGNRRHTSMFLDARLNEFHRHNLRFGLLFIDLDHFKNLNDTWGHEVGDEVLRVTARTIGSSLRSFDYVGRWGGEEFLVVVAHANEKILTAIAERTRALVEASRPSFHTEPLAVTISVGGTLVQAGDTAESIIKRADELLYESKRQGRNRVTLDFGRSTGQSA
jgi:diguanylate cyclase (GGDEF)-like protein/PAS domain S-box-containing protein